MVTADQILCHFLGDYIAQSDWMANEKIKRSIGALWHITTYIIPFLFLRPSLAAALVIIATHFVIDRWRLARYLVWTKNFIAPQRILIWQREDGTEARIFGRNYPWSVCKATGYPPQTPAWLAVWLMIIADNIIHVLINALALRYL